MSTPKHDDLAAESGSDPRPGDSDTECQLDFEKELAASPEQTAQVQGPIPSAA